MNGDRWGLGGSSPEISSKQAGQPARMIPLSALSLPHIPPTPVTHSPISSPPAPRLPTSPPLPPAAGKDINGKELFVGRAQKKTEREAMLRAK